MIDSIQTQSVSRLLNNKSFTDCLEKAGVEILDSFLEHRDIATAFNARVYGDHVPKVALVGINPGRLGAGKTGVPFLDMRSLKKILPDLEHDDAERSAEYFFSVVESIGVEKFYKKFYVTNVSPVGFSKDKKNLNFDALPQLAQECVFVNFRTEIEQVGPQRIITMGSVVNEAMLKLFGDSFGPIPNLAHPNYCAFPKNREKQKKKYLEVMSS